jgi:hypothetical protein
VPPGIKEDILLYYADLNPPFATKKKPQRWAALLNDMQTMQAMPTTTAPEPFATYGDDANDGAK